MKIPCLKRGRPDVASLFVPWGDQMLLRFFCTGEGSKRIRFPFSPGWEKGLGDEGENVEE